jgi:hypothetical protein
MTLSECRCGPGKPRSMLVLNPSASSSRSFGMELYLFFRARAFGDRALRIGPGRGTRRRSTSRGHAGSARGQLRRDRRPVRGNHCRRRCGRPVRHPSGRRPHAAPTDSGDLRRLSRCRASTTCIGDALRSGWYRCGWGRADASGHGACVSRRHPVYGRFFLLQRWVCNLRRHHTIAGLRHGALESFRSGTLRRGRCTYRPYCHPAGP